MTLEIRYNQGKHYIQKEDIVYEFTKYGNHMRILGFNHITNEDIYRANKYLTEARKLWSSLLKDGFTKVS